MYLFIYDLLVKKSRNQEIQNQEEEERDNRNLKVHLMGLERRAKIAPLAPKPLA